MRHSEYTPRRSIPVNVIRLPRIGEKVVITWHGDGHYPHGEFALSSAEDPENPDDTIAESFGAKRLSDWAFEHGVNEVKHDYDLKLSDGEP